MTKPIFFATALVALLFASLAHAGAPDAGRTRDPHSINLGGPEPVIELKETLGPYHAPGGGEAGTSVWYMLTAVNASARPAIRVLQAGKPASAGLRFLPRPTRPAILGIASSDPSVIVEPASAYGRHAYSVTIPPRTSVALAFEISNAQSPPSLLAWTPSALAAHNRQLGIFLAAVAGLIFAAVAITGGLAVMTGHTVPRWAAATLTLVLLARLADSGLFDGNLATHVGGPYGLAAFFAGLAVAAGACLADSIVPIREELPWASRWFKAGMIVLVALAAFAYLGVPGATVMTDIAVVGGTAGIAAYLVHRGRYGSQPARVAAPSAAVFALVALAAAITTLSGAGDISIAPDLAGGFTAAGAVLLALAVAAGEGIAVLPLPRVMVLPAAQSSQPAPQAPSAALQAIGASHQGIFDLDFNSGQVKLSREAASLIGLSETAGRMRHEEWLARVHDDDRAVYEKALADYRAHTGLAFRIEFRARSESGRYPWFELRATMMGEGARARRCLGLMADVTMRKESEAAMMERTLRDPLTGLGNRVALMEELEKLGAGLKDATVALLDIDRFKSIHASLGDVGGDDVLSQVAERLKKRFGTVAEIFRVGGDAFAVLFAQAGGPEVIGAELVEACGEPYEQNGRSIFAPASVGVTVGREARDPLELLKNAELALIQAKRHGGACMRVYSRELDALAPNDSVTLEAELRRALEDRQLDVYYQPIVKLADGTVGGFEALLRWRHPAKGVISPDDFIAHSETSGLIVALGRFALQCAARDLAQWQRFFPLHPPLFVSVNLSRRQLRDPEFEPFLRKLLAGSGIIAGTLALEVTESAVASDTECQAALARIRALGAGLAIDDFGTGQSSLSQLKNLTFDTVKVDKSFLARGADGASEGEVLLASIVALVRDLKRHIVVEGVETEEDAQRLQEVGCEFAQGFYFSPPLAPADTLNYLALHYDPGAAATPDASGAAGFGG